LGQAAEPFLENDLGKEKIAGQFSATNGRNTYLGIGLFLVERWYR